MQVFVAEAWGRSMDLFLSFLDDAVYNTALDPTMKTALKAHRTTEEMLEYTAFEERLTAITGAFENEALLESKGGRMGLN